MWSNYKRHRNLTTALIRKAKARYNDKLNNILWDSSTSSKKWWGVVRYLYGRKFQISVPTLLEDPVFPIYAKDKANLLNVYFCEQCSVDDENAILPEMEYFQNDVFLSEVQTSEREVCESMKHADVSKACGEDGIGNNIIKISAEGDLVLLYADTH